MIDKLMRWPAVRQATGLSRSTVWRLEQTGDFPRRHQLGANSVGWPAADIKAWLNSRKPVTLSATATEAHDPGNRPGDSLIHDQEEHHGQA